MAGDDDMLAGDGRLATCEVYWAGDTHVNRRVATAYISRFAMEPRPFNSFERLRQASRRHAADTPPLTSSKISLRKKISD